MIASVRRRAAAAAWAGSSWFRIVMSAPRARCGIAAVKTSAPAGPTRAHCEQGLGASTQFAQERVVRLEGRDLDPRVQGQYTVRPGNDRIEVEIGDFGQVIGEPRDPEQQVAERPEVRHRVAAVFV